ncbi:MAG: VCBS repeat-containing protein, partial [Candidatus Hydrogenedentes bacterium]|nr:VCBS repeat-containing protein [Candidatus Hydrogenedentota bacterium]
MLITALLISLAASSDPITFSEHLIFDQFSYPYGIAAGDFDGDGDLDISSADCKTNDSLYWFENDGAGRFTQHFVQKNDPERLERHALGDINGDGHLDIVIVKNLRGHLLWFENSGTPRDGKLWKRHVITTDLPGAYDVALADIDLDGDLDVAASSWILGNQFAWFENDGSPDDGTWTKHMIEADLDETRTIRAADFAQDGDVDFLGV